VVGRNLSDGMRGHTLRFRGARAACGEGGFAGVSSWRTDLDAILVTLTLREIRLLLDDNRASAFEVEFIEDRHVDGERKATSDNRNGACS
jgi:hypothetical protein